jgi:hypothetical protein
VAERADRAAALLPAQRRRLGRRALAGHGDLPRALDDGRLGALRPYLISTKTQRPRDANALVAAAHEFLGRPTLTDATLTALRRFATNSLADANANWKRSQYPSLIENALRHLIAVSPDYQTC